MEVYRITTKKWADTLQASGYMARWNSNGVFVIYTACSKSLACLENLVHRNFQRKNELFKVVTIHIPDNITGQEITLNEIEKSTSKEKIDWKLPGIKPYRKCGLFGDKWALANSSLYLKTPSAIIPDEYNILINPNHPHFSKVKILSVEDFYIDRRLLR